jgi:hypothetical protein
VRTIRFIWAVCRWRLWTSRCGRYVRLLGGWSFLTWWKRGTFRRGIAFFSMMSIEMRRRRLRH